MKRTKITYIEEQIVKEIQEIAESNSLQQRTTDKLYFIVDSILTTARQKNNSDYTYVSKSRNYWKTCLSGSYGKYIKLLLDKEIIECNDSYSTKTRTSKKYKIHPRFAGDVSLKEVIYKITVRKEIMTTSDMKDLKQFYEKYINNFNENEFLEVMNEELKDLTGATYKMKRRAWMSSYGNLEQGFLYANRNKTNNRLDTNFTNMPSQLRKLIMKWNNLAEIDMVNSQPMLLSTMIQDDPKFNGNSDPDTVYFHKLCKTGKLYDTLATRWDKTRDEIKEEVFFILYSKASTYRQPHEKFNEMFQPIFDYIINIKETEGNNQFAIKLQKLESEIWIDTIKPSLNRNNIIHTTVHDSVIIHEDNLDLSYELIKSELNKREIHSTLTKHSTK